jgi:hypothetical protein
VSEAFALYVKHMDAIAGVATLVAVVWIVVGCARGLR